METSQPDHIKELETLVDLDQKRRLRLLTSGNREKNWSVFQLIEVGDQTISAPEDTLSSLEKLHRRLEVALIKRAAQNAGLSAQEMEQSMALGASMAKRRKQLAELSGIPEYKRAIQKIRIATPRSIK